MFAAWVLLGLLTLLPAPGAAQEVFSWWRRELLPLQLPAGAWIRLEREEAAEGRVIVDTLLCRVLAEGEGGARWVELNAASSEERWILKVRPDRVPVTDDLLQAVARLFRLGPGDIVVEEDVDELRESRLVRRHFEDLFSDPTLERTALPDTLWGEQTLSRERVVLTETEEARTPMGSRVLVHVTELRAEAVLSPAVPVFGLLRSWTRTVVTSRWEGAEGGASRRSAPPLVTEVHLRCLAFGQEAPRGLPAALPLDP